MTSRATAAAGDSAFGPVVARDHVIVNVKGLADKYGKVAVVLDGISQGLFNVKLKVFVALLILLQPAAIGSQSLQFRAVPQYEPIPNVTCEHNKSLLTPSQAVSAVIVRGVTHKLQPDVFISSLEYIKVTA
jgi:hypothetical protein